MDIKQLEYFVEAMRTNSFTKAADALYITQQGISKSIKRLEEELGVPLFSRTSSAIMPTKYAEAFFPYAMEMLGTYKDSVNAVEEIKRIKENNNLRVGISPGLSNVLSADILTEFMRENPDTVISLSEYSDGVLDKAVINDMLDIGFCILPVDENKITVHHIWSELTCYMLSESHPLAAKNAISLGDLKDELFLGFGIDNKGHSILEARCMEYGFKPKMGIQTQDTHVLEDLVRKNLGVSFYVGHRKNPISGVKLIPDASGDWYYKMAVVTKKGKKLNKDMIKLINLFKQW